MKTAHDLLNPIDLERLKIFITYKEDKHQDLAKLPTSLNSSYSSIYRRFTKLTEELAEIAKENDISYRDTSELIANIPIELYRTYLYNQSFVYKTFVNYLVHPEVSHLEYLNEHKISTSKFYKRMHLMQETLSPSGLRLTYKNFSIRGYEAVIQSFYLYLIRATHTHIDFELSIPQQTFIQKVLNHFDQHYENVTVNCKVNFDLICKIFFSRMALLDDWKWLGKDQEHYVDSQNVQWLEELMKQYLTVDSSSSIHSSDQLYHHMARLLNYLLTIGPIQIENIPTDLMKKEYQSNLILSYYRENLPQPQNYDSLIQHLSRRILGDILFIYMYGVLPPSETAMEDFKPSETFVHVVDRNLTLIDSDKKINAKLIKNFIYFYHFVFLRSQKNVAYASDSLFHIFSIDSFAYQINKIFPIVPFSTLRENAKIDENNLVVYNEYTPWIDQLIKKSHCLSFQWVPDLPNQDNFKNLLIYLLDNQQFFTR